MAVIEPDMRCSDVQVGDGLVQALRVRVDVPLAVVKGHDAVLHCNYDLENEILYVVKWYKKNDEFYRFTRIEKPPVKVFAIQNSTAPKVDITRSNSTHLFLKDVERADSDTYLCEVSAEKPSFLTKFAGGKMEVVEIPDNAPELIGLPQRCQPGDIITVNCTSSKSYPPANLSMAVNGKQPEGERVINYHVEADRAGLKECVMGLRFKVKPEYFRNGSMKVLCRASIYNVYWKITEKAVEEERSRLPPPTTLETNQPPGKPWDDLDYRGSSLPNERQRNRNKSQHSSGHSSNGKDRTRTWNKDLWEQKSLENSNSETNAGGNSIGGSCRSQPYSSSLTIILGSVSIVRIIFTSTAARMPLLSR